MKKFKLLRNTEGVIPTGVEKTGLVASLPLKSSYSRTETIKTHELLINYNSPKKLCIPTKNMIHREEVRSHENLEINEMKCKQNGNTACTSYKNPIHTF